MATSISVDVTNYDAVCKDLRKVPKKLAVGLARFNTRMARKTIETVVRKEVTQVYNISKGDVSKKGPHNATKVQVITLAGVAIPFYNVTFTGQVMTPRHFGMTPKARPNRTPPFVWGRKGSRNYQVRWKPFKGGGRQVLTTDYGLPAFITTGRGGTETAFVRRPDKMGLDIIKRLSVPQMIENDKVAPQIQQEIEKRIDKELARLLK